MHFELLTIGALAAFIHAAPAPDPHPTITAAPSKADAVLAPRATSAGFYWALLSAAQAADSSMNHEFSIQPHMSAAAAVSFGDFDPANIISSISASCRQGCAGTTTTVTATSVPSVSNSHVANPTKIAIEYVVSTDVIPDQPGAFDVFVEGLAAMMSGKSVKHEEFTYNYVLPSVYGPPVEQYLVQENYFGPAHIQLNRYTQDNLGNYVDLTGTFGMAITSQDITESNNGLCNEIAAPLSAALSAIPDVGPVFGVVGSLVCDAVS